MLNTTALLSNLRARRNTTELTIQPLERYPSKKKWQPYFSLSKKSPQCIEDIILDISKHALQGNETRAHALWMEWQDELKPEHILKILQNLQINSTSPTKMHPKALSPTLFLNILTKKNSTPPLSLYEIPQATIDALASDNLDTIHTTSSWINCSVLQEILNQTKIQEHSPLFELCIVLIESIPLHRLLNYKSILKTLIEHQHLSILKPLFNHYGIYPLHQQALKIAKSLSEINPHTQPYIQTLEDIHQEICNDINSKIHAPFLALGNVNKEDLIKIDELIEFKLSVQYIIMLSKCCHHDLKEQYTLALLGSSEALQENQSNTEYFKDDDSENPQNNETKDFLDEVKAFNLFIQKESHIDNLHKKYLEEAFGKSDDKIINKVLSVLNLDTGNLTLWAYVKYRVESWSTPQMKNKILSLYECSQNVEPQTTDNSLDELSREPIKEPKRTLKKVLKNIPKNTPLSALIFSNTEAITASEQERDIQTHEPEPKQVQPKETFGLHFS